MRNQYVTLLSAYCSKEQKQKRKQRESGLEELTPGLMTCPGCCLPAPCWVMAKSTLLSPLLAQKTVQ